MLRSTLIATAASIAVAASANAAIVITEVMSASAHTGGTNNGDWFELTNTGTTSVSLTGWSWNDNDASGSAGNFGSLTSIPAGASVIISEETAGAEASFKSNWGIPNVTVVNLGSTVFQGLSGPNGDQVNVYNDLSQLVASVTFGTATAGFSFEWDKTGTSLGSSVLNENGAFRAVSNGQTSNPGAGVDIGSPGSAVPEPASLSLLAMGALAGVRRRRVRAD